MSFWDDSHWIDIDAYIYNVFAGADEALIDYGFHTARPGGYVGYRQLVSDQQNGVSYMLEVACLSMQLKHAVRLRVMNDGRVAAIQTVYTQSGVSKVLAALCALIVMARSSASPFCVVDRETPARAAIMSIGNEHTPPR